MFTHQPTWDDCQQLLQILFTTEEGERIILKARKKMFLGKMGLPLTQNPATIDDGFALCHPVWNYNSAEGREHLKVYRQALLADGKMPQ